MTDNESITVLVSPGQVPIQDRPVLFLAGPIQGAEDWQASATEMIVAGGWDGPEILVANPRRPGPWSNEAFQEQIDWEHQHLGWALEYGVVLFWLGRQDKSLPFPANRSYAQTTRFELGYIVGQLRKTIKWGLAGYCPLAVGVDEGFSGRHYIEYMLQKEFLGKVSVHKTLSDTVDSALGTLSLMLSEP